MSPSVLFWLTVAAGFAVVAIALAMILVVVGLGVGRRANRRLNGAYVLFAGAAILIGAGSALAHVAHWYEPLGLSGAPVQGAPLFWMELAAMGYLLLGPSLLAFAHEYASTPTFGDSEKSDASSADNRLCRTVVILGFLAALGLLPIVFGHRAVRQLLVNGAAMLQPELTPVGYVITIGPMLLGLLALTRFWQHRESVGGKGLSIATGLWFIGSAAAIASAVPLALALLALGISVAMAGYVVITQQVLVPLATLTGKFDSELADRTRELEHIRDRLQWRNELQRRIAHINSELAQISEPSSMLARLAELLQTSLGYQHVYVYQVEDADRELAVRAAAGTAARTILESEHRLAIGGNSLVGQVALQRRPRLADDRDDESVFADTALPRARSEMSVPVILGDRLLGVLDFQSIHLDAFTEEDLDLVACLASQVAVSLDRCQAFQEIQTTLDEEHAPLRHNVRQTWRALLAERESTAAFIYNESDTVVTTSPSAAWSPDVAQVASSGQLVTSSAGNSREDAPGIAALVLTLPIRHRGQVIGSLQLRRKPGHTWEREDIAAVSLIADRMGQALENARMLETAQRHAEREQFISSITARMREETDVESLLETAAREISAGLDLAALDVRLGTESDLGAGTDQSASPDRS